MLTSQLFEVMLYSTRLTCGWNGGGSRGEGKVLDGAGQRGVVLQAPGGSGHLVAAVVVGHLDVPLPGGGVAGSDVEVDTVALLVGINNHWTIDKGVKAIRNT